MTRMEKASLLAATALIALAVLPHLANADSPYVRADAGAIFWENIDNGDDPELQEGPEEAFSLEAGYQWTDIYGELDLAAGVSVMFLDASVHGGPDKLKLDPETETFRKTDGSQRDCGGHVIPISFNLWPGFRLDNLDTELYGGGGVGPTNYEACDDNDWGLGWQAGLGAYYNLPQDLTFGEKIDIHLGYRAVGIFDEEYLGHVGLAGIRWRFN